MISRLVIQNFKGIERLEADLDPQLVIVEGDNGEGKSSLLDSFRCIVDGGGGLEQIRNGERKANIDLVLDNGVTLRKTITPKRANLDVEYPEGIAGEMPPKEYVNTLMSGVGFDPLRFCTADKKERLAYLLQVAPIHFGPDELRSIGVSAAEATAIVDLDGLAAIEQRIRDTRKRANDDVKSAEGTIARLEKDLPPDDGTDWQKRWRELESEAADVEQQIAAQERKVHDEAAAQERAIIDEIDAKIKELLADKEKRLSAVRVEKERKQKRIAEVAKPEREQLSADKATAWERSQSQGRVSGQRETIKTMKVDVRAKSVESERLTRTLGAIAELRNKKLSSLPVEGVRITPEGDLFVDDIAFDQLNTSSQFFLSFQFAKLRGQKFMLADHGECLGPAAWRKFCAAIRKQNDIQVVVAVRTKGPLKVHAGPTVEMLEGGDGEFALVGT